MLQDQLRRSRKHPCWVEEKEKAELYKPAFSHCYIPQVSYVKMLLVTFSKCSIDNKTCFIITVLISRCWCLPLGVTVV